MPKPRKSGPASPETTPISAAQSSALPAETGPPLASARWLISVLLAVCGLALVCVYGAVCLLYWQGQWQFAFPPQDRSAKTAASKAGVRGQRAPAPPHQEVGFDSTDTGVLQLHGWWIPAAGGAHAAGTILFMHGGAESLDQLGGELQALHSLGVNVFAFDYRGFGKSVPLHPSETSVAEDADAAWRYLTDRRHLAPEGIVMYGRKLGATIAAEAALRHPHCAGLVLEAAVPPLLDRLRSRGLTRILPLSFIFHDRFNPSAALASAAVPKLFLSDSSDGSTDGLAPNAPLYYAVASEPKMLVPLNSSSGGALYSDPQYSAAIDRFLRQHLPAD